jgi:hypothetical protein
MSTLKTDVVETSSGGATTLTKQSAAKAWINFSGTGTVSTRDSFNFSSLVDNGTGNYSTNYASNMSANDYSVATAVGQTSPFPIVQAYLANVVPSYVQLNTAQPGNADYDWGLITSTSFGDLA